MLDLRDVTLCCVDTRSVAQALESVSRCMAQAHFGRVLFLGPQPDTSYTASHKGMDWITIPTLGSIQDYNRIMLQGLVEHISTSHVLIVQWDSFITHPQCWQPEFLTVDYIGPPWYHRGQPGRVGNGGFSLRSRRLLNALASLKDLDTTEPEDRLICIQRRDELECEYGVRFAPLNMAQAFGCEYGGYRPSFGFHGMHNFAHIMDADELADWLSAAPPDLLTTKHARNLIKELILTKRRTEARALIQRRSQLTGWNQDHILLYIRTFSP